MIVKQKLFKPCEEGRHSQCKGEIIKENPDDVSQPRYKLKCNCPHHKKEPQFKVPAIYKMILPECAMKDHEKCPKRIFNSVKNAEYICTCKHHRREEEFTEE